MEDAPGILEGEIERRMDIAVLEQTSEQFLSKWKRFVSTTNWEKGQIISQWRAALVDAGAGLAEYSDEVWSRQVGQVTPQHVGRLRRVFERFGDTRDTYAGLYWSHFQAALDWDDAEMWLEGAVQSNWSIAQMQAQRSQTLGALVQDQVEAAAIEIDEDAADVPPNRPPDGAAASANDAGAEAVIQDDIAVDAAGEVDAGLHDAAD